MKYKLPEIHGLSEQIIETLIHTADDSPSLTDIQYAALESGIGNGCSALVVSPTSTGKTQIAVWAIANGIETNSNTVYLVTHRALAKQKFDDFKNLLGDNYFNNDLSKIVLATGDNVINGQDESPADPLRAQLLVATYEKYLAMLSASGVPSSMANTVVVCDEIQLLGDRHRGQNVEVLLTLLKNAGWKQFVGLSAVLYRKDAKELSNWLNVALVLVTNREKELQYEYWNSSGIDIITSSRHEEVKHAPLPIPSPPDVLKVIRHLEEQDRERFPVIVFCMRKQDVHELASADLEYRIAKRGFQQPLDLGDIPVTTSSSFLSKSLAYRIAIHSTDLTDDERKVVESGLINGHVDVVYATSTLAAGVNFPLGAAIFNRWQRFSFDEKTYLPIDPAEFHNMAGRVGRMGSDHKGGRVIIFPETGAFADSYKRYLDLDAVPPIVCRIGSTAFDQLSIQLVAAGLCHTREDVKKLICTSFSGLREEDHNFNNFKLWPTRVDRAIDSLIENNMLAEMKDLRLISTPFGKAVAHSGFKPQSAIMLLDYLSRKGIVLSELLSYPINDDNINKFAYLIFAASFSTPEFHAFGHIQQSRFLPWPLGDQIYDASPYSDDLLEPNWYADPSSTNSAQVALDWINGAKLIDQEKVHSSLKAGMLLDMYRNLGWALQGLVSIISAASDSRIPDPLRPSSLRGQIDLLKSLRKLPRSITRLNFRVSSGLPDDTLW
ncbi:DEAD/DEAH box helicase [anaerobic digester metagenome]